MSKFMQQGIIFFKNDVEIIVCEMLYCGFFLFDLYCFCYCLFNGGMSGEIICEIFECGYVVVLLFFDLVCDEVVLVE